MKIKASVVADSINEFANRLTTLLVVMPRYILAEFNTHRMLSRNSASSMAIPFEKNLKNIQEHPFIPIAWMRDHRGMQGSEYFTDSNEIDRLEKLWLYSRDYSIKQAEALSEEGLTKQLVNRLLEPFMYHTVLCSATEWENFFALRCPQYVAAIDATTSYRSRKDATKIWDGAVNEMDEVGWLRVNRGQADIHMMATAEAIWDAMNESKPKELKAGEWHIPFGDTIEGDNFAYFYSTIYQGDVDLKKINELAIKIAVARCARVSYTVVGEEGKPDNYENDIKLHDRLAASGHWSPFEHCAQVMTFDQYHDVYGDGMSGNFKGFIQYRKMFHNENIVK